MDETTQGYQTNITNTPYADTQPMTTSEALKILQGANLNANEVLSADNIQSTLNQTTPATTSANSIDDLLGIRSDIYNTLGVNNAQTAYQTALKSAQDAQNALNSVFTGISGRPVSLSKITGQQSQAQRTYGNSIDALNDAADLAQSDYLAKKSEADTQFSIRESEIKEKRSYQLQYSGAGIKLSDDWDTVAKKLSDYQEEQEKDAYKSELKKMAIQYGISTKGLSTKNLEKKISKVNKSAAEQAKQEANLKLEQIKLDIENTKSLIANRGSEESDKSNLKTFQEDGKTYFYDSNTGDVFRPDGIDNTSDNLFQDETEGTPSDSNFKWYNPLTWF